MGTEKEGASRCCGFLLLFLPHGVARGFGCSASIDLQRNLLSARQNSNWIPVRLCSESVVGLVCCLNRHQADVLDRSDPVDSVAPTLDRLAAYARDRSTSYLHWLVRPSAAVLGCGRVPLRWCLPPTAFQCLALHCAARSLIRIGAAGCPAALGRRSFSGVPVAARPSACARSAVAFLVRLPLVACRSLGRN